MKKIYTLLLAMTAGLAANAQIANGGMETWRNSTTGTSPVVSIHAPTSWYGFDSIIVADAEAFRALIGTGTDLHAQLFQESTRVNSGTYSAKVISVNQDVAGIVPGFLSNAKISIDVFSIIGGGTFGDAITYFGGTKVTGRVDTVTAWVAYFPGIDSITHTMGGADTAILTVTARGKKHGVDTVLGSGLFVIKPSSTFTRISAAIIYNDTTSVTDTIRVTFSSGGGGTSQPLDSSTLYVDDVNFVYRPNAVPSVTINPDAVNIYPNPASNFINIENKLNANLSINLYSINGQLVASKSTTGNSSMDISILSAGLYFFVVNDEQGNAIKQGKINIAR